MEAEGPEYHPPVLSTRQMCSNRAATRVNDLKAREKRNLKIRAFAALLHSPEKSSKVSCRPCTAEVRGSNPLGSTSKISTFAGETLNTDER